MKILQNKDCGENRIAVIDDDNNPVCFYFQRDIALNINDIITAKVISFHPTLKGYFLETEKGNAFLPDTSPLIEGETITVRVKREARFEKEATVERTAQIPQPIVDRAIELATKFNTGINAASSIEMDDLIEESIISNIRLRNGAELHIERTRVGWTIDVDSGTSWDNLKDINMAAILEISRQVVLKNMSGIILIDLAGSKRGYIRTILEKSLRQNFEKDDRTTVSGWTPAGLFELQRTRTTASLWDIYRENPIAIYYKIVRAYKTCRTGHPIVIAHPNVIALLAKNHPEIKTKPCFNKPISFFEILEE